MKKFLKICGFILIPIFLIWLVTLNAGPKVSKIEYGVTFSEPYAKSLGLDWKQVYISMLDDLKVKDLRLSAYWDEVEKNRDQFSFDDLDFQINEASARNTKVVAKRFIGRESTKCSIEFY